MAYEILEDARKSRLPFDAVLVPCRWREASFQVFLPISKKTDPRIEVIGVEAEGARSMKAAFEAGGPVKLPEIDKFADGIAVQKVGQLTHEAPRQHVETLVGVDEGLISETLIDLYSKQGIVAEPAGAASVASLEILRNTSRENHLLCIISGGNNDINRMPEMKNVP